MMQLLRTLVCFFLLHHTLAFYYGAVHRAHAQRRVTGERVHGAHQNPFVLPSRASL